MLKYDDFKYGRLLNVNSMTNTNGNTRNIFNFNSSQSNNNPFNIINQ